MAQRKPEENVRVQQVLKLVDELTPPERDEVLYQLKLQDLRREIQTGLDAAERGDVVSLEELNEHLDAIQAKYLERQK
jgi:hypothetical protein